jgi:hypothetical protein
MTIDTVHHMVECGTDSIPVRVIVVEEQDLWRRIYTRVTISGVEYYDTISREKINAKLRMRP